MRIFVAKILIKTHFLPTRYLKLLLEVSTDGGREGGEGDRGEHPLEVVEELMMRYTLQHLLIIIIIIIIININISFIKNM